MHSITSLKLLPLASRLLSNSSAKAPVHVPTYTFIGAGAMAEAMISPLLALTPTDDPNLLPNAPPTIIVNELNASRAAQIKRRFPALTVADDLSAAVARSDLIVMAVKPQNVDAVFSELAPVLAERPKVDKPVVLSICAGVPIRKFVEGLGCEKIVRR